MATLFVATVVTATGWELAAYYAAAMYLDANHVMPALFLVDPTYGPQIEGQPIGRWSEGTGIPRVFGASGRVPGQVIWQSPIKEIKEETDTGGKGGGGGTYVVYKYYANVAVAFCTGPVARVKQVFADGKTIWNVAPDIDYSTTLIDGVLSSYQFRYGSNPAYYHFVTMISSGVGSPDLSLIKSGKKIVLTTPFDSGTVEVISSDAQITAGTTTCKVQVASLTTSVHPWTAWTTGTTTIHQDLPTHSGNHLNWVRFHNGSVDQQPDSMLETYKGVGEVPAFRGITYIIIDDLALMDWGNRIPSFSAIIEEDENRTVAEAVTRILDEGDLDPGEYDLSGVESKICEGYAVAGPQETIKSLQPLLIQNDVLVQQQDSSLRFFHRKDARRVDIKFEHLAAGKGATPIEVQETPTSQLPDEINVEYLDINNNYNKGSQRQRRNNDVSTKEQGVNLNVVMPPAEARAIASRLLWTAWNERLRVRFKVPALEYVDKLREGDVARFTALDEDWEILIQKMDRGANLMLECEGTVEDKNMLAGYSAAEDVDNLIGGGDENGYMGGNPSFIAPALRFIPFESRPLREKHLRSPGFYFAVCSADPRYNFRGGGLYESLDGDNYTKVDEVSGASFIGETTAYTVKTAYHGQWDLVNEITVEFLNGTPQSVTEIQVLNGANRALFGQEIIGFQTATHVSGTTYKLTKLLRGLRGTESHMADVTASLRTAFVLLNQPFVHFHELPAGAIGTTRYYKMVPHGAILEEVPAETYTVQGLTTKPLPPTDVTKVLDGSSNATVSWVPRYRSIARIFGTGGRPSGEPKEEFKIELRNPADSATVLELTSTESESREITASQQTTAGYVAGTTIKVRLSQFSEYHKFGDATSTHTI